VRNCIGFADLLCAYADGELPESSKRSVEDHLAICDNCSAVIKVYKEITTAVNETNVPAPEALSIGVMNRIRSEDVPRVVTVTKQRLQYKRILTRYAPIAACLIVTLLVWQFWGDLFGTGNNFATENAAPMADTAPAATSAGGTQTDTEDSAAAVPQAFDGGADDIAAEVYAEESEDGATGRIIYGSNTDDDEAFKWFYMIDGLDLIDDSVMIYINNAYAVVSVIGNMPVFLTEHQAFEKTSHDDWWIQSGWDEVYEIPVAELSALLDELGSAQGVQIAHNSSDINSDYVVVVYSRGA